MTSPRIVRVHNPNWFCSNVPLDAPELWPTFQVATESVGELKAHILRNKLTRDIHFSILVQIGGIWVNETALFGQLPADPYPLHVRVVEGRPYNKPRPAARDHPWGLLGAVCRMVLKSMARVKISNQ